MKKYLSIFVLLLTLAFGANAQPYGNEWINYSQQYFKIKIAKTDIYRITPATLAAAGVPTNTIDPRNIQLFNNGIEQKIYIEGEDDGVLNTTDFIEFYGQKNDGRNELELYSNTNFVPNPYYSLINDTAVYFLTWNNSIGNLRMVEENDVNFGAYTPVNYFFKEVVQDYHNKYYGGETNSSGGTVSQYVASEGYFDASVITLGNSIQKNIATPNLYSTGPATKFETVVIGASKSQALRSSVDHHLTINYKASSNSSFNTIKDTLFYGYESMKFKADLVSNSLENGTVEFQYSSIAEPNYTSNRTTISYIKLKYPHTLDMENASRFLFYLPNNNTQSKSYLSFSNFSNSGQPFLYNLSEGIRTPLTPNGSNLSALVSNNGNEQACYLTSDQNISSISSIEAVSSTARFTDYQALAADSAFVIVHPKQLSITAQEYKAYRSADIYGGLHNVVLADIDELYDQFAYGIGKSPLSIKGFAGFLLNTYPSPPKNLLLLGKGIYMPGCRTSVANYKKCLIPSFGYPASDPLLTAGINGTVFEPAIPTGRIAATNDNEVRLYLNKIKAYENQSANPPASWKKQVLHFGGGTTNSEQLLFKSYLNRYKDTLSGTFYGATVDEFFKTSSAPIQINSSERVRNYIDNGISLMTFFGHASGLGFDQNIDDINSYNPKNGRYPFMLALGCFVGNIHGAGAPSSSEVYTLTDKGVIGYLGTLGLGIPYALNTYAQEWYNQLAKKSYGKSVGTLIQQTIKTITPYAQTDDYIAGVCFEMTLHGDPSIKLNAQQRPDYAIHRSDLHFNTDTYVDSIVVSVVRTNIGKATNDTIITNLTRTLPNGESEEFTIETPAPLFKDTIYFTLFIDVNKGVGVNKFNVELDALNRISEENENNNSTGLVEHIISIRGIKPVFPYQFSIIPTDTITLKGSTFNLFESSQNYIFQLDTTDSFNSPFMSSKNITSIGGVVEWKPSMSFVDSTVYYWRISPDSINSQGYLWQESSFQYIAGKSGWGQADFYQFKPEPTTYQFIEYNRSQKNFNFPPTLQTIECKNGIYPNAIDWTQINWKLNGYVKEYWHCNRLSPSISVVVIDPQDVSNLESPPVSNPAEEKNNGIYGNCHCRNRPQQTLDFLVSTPAQRNYLIDFLNSSAIPTGHYVLAYTMNKTNIPSYEEALFQAFESFGAAQIRTTSSNLPYICFGRKGEPIGSATEVLGTAINEVIDLNTTFNSTWTNGTISSPVIGPASRWGSFHWRQKSVDGNNLGDETSVTLIGIEENGTETPLVTFSTDSLEILNLANYVDAATYPKIRLVAYLEDLVNSTPAQIERWQVIYEPLPEGAIVPNEGFYISNDKLNQGEAVDIHIPFKNISNKPFLDSLVYSYWIENTNGQIILLPSNLQKSPLNPNEITVDTFSLNTIDYPGIEAIWVDINPLSSPRNQPEQFHFNNSTRIPVTIVQDEQNPILDVTFDGRHILNNEIISASPIIVMTLKDENLFLALNDTSKFKVYIKKPGETLGQAIPFGETLTFSPAILPDNSAKIMYTPSFTLDGMYELTVQAADRSNNESGSADYRINFEIVTKSTITEVMNYPNPFSTATQFVFTLTGQEIPTYFKIQILSITGKVVREITQDELGTIRIGRNITDYAWDGKDEFGDQLANGVYLYRVVTSIRGQEIEKQASEASTYFKKGFGKMYLMR